MRKHKITCSPFPSVSQLGQDHGVSQPAPLGSASAAMQSEPAQTEDEAAAAATKLAAAAAASSSCPSSAGLYLQQHSLCRRCACQAFHVVLVDVSERRREIDRATVYPAQVATGEAS